MFNNAHDFNQPLGDWETGNINIMTGMFNTALKFNQDLSGWCVTRITAKPTSFDTSASLWTLPKPVWGTCPP
jgi:hypothetical protein